MSLDPPIIPELPPIAPIWSRSLAAMFPTVLLVGPGETARHELRDGMTIGRDERCDIRLSHADVCPIHARVVRSASDGLFHVMIAQNGFALTLPSGADSTNVPLLPGVRFKIGPIELRCPGSLNVRFACPRCRSALVLMPADARFCARCGLELPPFCPPWEPGDVDRSVPATHHHPMFFAYLNALFNLGLRYESHERDPQQAVRYFEKAAKLGSVPARVRLDSATST